MVTIRMSHFRDLLFPPEYNSYLRRFGLTHGLSDLFPVFKTDYTTAC